MSETPTQTLAKLLEESNAQVVFDQKTVRAIVAEKDARIAELEAVIESDRSKLADAVTQIHKVLDGKFWLTEGRGSYTWDDDRYRQEFHDAAVDLLAAIKSIEKLAADLSNSPKTSDAVHAARLDKDARISRLEAAILHLADLRSAYWDRPHNGHGWRLIETDCGAMRLLAEGVTPLEVMEKVMEMPKDVNVPKR